MFIGFLLGFEGLVGAFRVYTVEGFGFGGYSVIPDMMHRGKRDWTAHARRAPAKRTDGCLKCDRPDPTPSPLNPIDPL